LKVTFVGGGAIRLFSTLRAAMGDRRIFPGGGEICLYDLAVTRAETLGRLLMKTPEYRSGEFRITWPRSLEEALEGATMVGVVLAPGSRRTAGLSDAVCYDHDYFYSDNVSPAGAMFAVKGGRVLMNIARTMEKVCPDAWLADFANPVAVFSGMINNHTRIKALGVCGGFTNHLWDIARILGEDRMLDEVEVEVAGINHLSFITRGTVAGRDLFEFIDEAVDSGWKMPPKLGPWSESTWRNITDGVSALLRFYRELDAFIFSTEGDGMDHLRYDVAIGRMKSHGRPPAGAELERAIARFQASRAEEDRTFAAYLNRDLDAGFWENVASNDGRLACASDDIFLRILRGIAGPEPVSIVTSRPNEGAVAGFDDRTVIEYSQTMAAGVLSARGELSVPPAVRGLVTALAAHQTLLGDAIATEDPKLLAQALLCYPWQPYTRRARSLYRELIAVNATEIPEALQKAVEFL